MTTDAGAAAMLALTRQATRVLRRADRSTGAERTRLLRQVADLLVDLRGLHTGTDGLPDWPGRSYAYRDAVRSIYAAAGLPPESSHATKTALRYHVGVALRERLPEETLAAAGLSDLDPRDRQQHRRTRLDVGHGAPAADHLIAQVLLAVRRLVDTRPRGLTDHDIARAASASTLLAAWVQEHREQ